jgi:Rieske Fe-S protein
MRLKLRLVRRVHRVAKRAGTKGALTGGAAERKGLRMIGRRGPSRRAVFLGAGATGAAAVLAACSDGNGTSRQPAPTTTAKDAQGGSTPPDVTAESTPGAGIPIAFVPVGGGYIDFNRGVVITQPEPAQFRAYDANCTHMRCFITWVADGLIQCPCHGSEFRISDGSVVRGPATQSLHTRAVTVTGDTVVVS